MEKTMEKIVSLAKSRGFVYPGSEIYGGLANTWDYGNLGVELKNNVKKAWWQKFIQEDPNNVGLDSAILMNPKTWEASGHLKTFSDPLIDCKSCKTRHRADKLLEEAGYADAAGLSNDDMVAKIKEMGIPCPDCGAKDFTDIRNFNLMFKTFQGVTEDNKNVFGEDLPYLKKVDSSFDQNENSSFEKTITLSKKEFYEKLNINYNEIYKHVTKRTSLERVHPEGRNLSNEIKEKINYNIGRRIIGYFFIIFFNNFAENFWKDFCFK